MRWPGTGPDAAAADRGSPLPPSFADHLIVGPAGGSTSGDGEAWIAHPAARLAHTGDVVIVALGPLDDQAWATVSERLAGLASIRSSWLPGLIEAGRSPGAGLREGWVVRDRPGARPLGPLAGGNPLRELAGAARGAHDLHQAGWAHGDIREATVLVEDGQGLLDLPLRAAAAGLPEVARVGSPTDLDGYEPDRLWGAGPTRASDVYALGALIHRRLTATLVHPDLPRDPLVIAAQRALLERPGLDPRLEGPAADLVRECLDPDPGRRPASALAVAERIEEMVGR